MENSLHHPVPPTSQLLLNASQIPSPRLRLSLSQVLAGGGGGEVGVGVGGGCSLLV